MQWYRYSFFALLFLTTASLALARPDSRVQRVSFTERADGQGYVIRIHTEGYVQAFTEPRRLENDVLELLLFKAKLVRRPRRDDPEGPVQSYTVGPFEEHLMFRFQLRPDQPLDVTAYRDRNSTDILLNLTYQTTPRTPVTTVANTPATPLQAQSGPAQAARERWRIDTIVIDAGHGGKDPGAIGVGGLREKDVALRVALQVGQYLEDLLGVRVVYTRQDDRFIPLAQRGRIANEAGGKLFISIHANANRDARAYGTETFFLGLHKTEAARKVMERENGVVRFEADQDAYTEFDEQGLILQTLTQSAYLRQSEQLATLVEHQFADRVSRKSRGVKQAGFYVLWGASMPAVLVELGFISNPREARFLRSESGQTYMASAIFRAIRDFKQEYEASLELSTSR